MEYWSFPKRKDGCSQLRVFIDKYRDWLLIQHDNARSITGFDDVISENLAEIAKCIERIDKGVACLEDNDDAWTAFVYMNKAMLMQRVNYKKIDGINLDPATIQWFPFQLSYILQIIPGIVDADNSWRNTVDLLWFPTGGGKTEAYLGLSAFVIFYRRLTKGLQGAGVNIIMRYTLRLLTAQQFERATALICACEYIRKANNIPGGEISIGLWVGLDMTPNKVERAGELIAAIKDGDIVHKENPYQIFNCSFCGTGIDIGCYVIEETMRIKCPNQNCFYHAGLPIYVVDEDIYKKRPTLLLSTIDKFARIVWDELTSSLFGTENDTLPPELIIQDELHLISGPLGSISGLYESALDYLCTYNNRAPKIIASTATVRNAKKQINALYNRNCFQFPPSGINLDDTFFAVKAGRESKPARRYVGICESSSSLVDTMVRIYGCLFFTLNYFIASGFEDKIIDQYWTIVGYFNSLKSLGSSATVILERVRLHSESLRRYKFKKYAVSVNMTKILINGFNELTSRKSSKEIKEALEELKYSYPDDRAYSYVLASNMLSVGIDIDRLGIMTVYNQPKTNAEYIQATSRVGRSNPGIIFSLYSALRSRDKSHYEQFIDYHRTFYKHVEPTSVTPYSYRAIEKAFHAVYVALIRHKISNLKANEDAKNYRTSNSQIHEVKQFILDRVKSIDESSYDHAIEWLEKFEGAWENTAIRKAESFKYSLRGKTPDTIYTLLVEAEKENLSVFPSTLNALRNVDSSSNVYIINRFEEGD